MTTLSAKTKSMSISRSAFIVEPANAGDAAAIAAIHLAELTNSFFGHPGLFYTEGSLFITIADSRNILRIVRFNSQVYRFGCAICEQASLFASFSAQIRCHIST